MKKQMKNKLRKPNVKSGIAKIERIEQFKKEQNFIIHFKSHKWDSFKVFINGNPTKKTDVNLKGLSRMEQLGLGDTYSENDYVHVDIAHIIVGETGYEKEGKLVPHTTSVNKPERLEIYSIKSSSEEIFNEAFRDFIAKEYEGDIDKKISTGWGLNDCLDFYMRKHRNGNV